MLCDLLVHVSGDQSGRKRVALAADLAQRSGARLGGLHIKPPPEIEPLYKPSQIDAAVAHLTAKLNVAARVAKAIFTEETAHRPLEIHWFEAEGDVAKGISNRARFADLVILGQEECQAPPERHPLPIAHSVVLMCGRPVLVVPADAQTLVPVNVAVAWDGSTEAVRAVHDALPLLKLAQTVHIVTMVSPTHGAGLEDLQDLVVHLAHHGITAVDTVEQVARFDERARLQHSIATGDYDLVIMGGYSHPRWLEYIFGGTTLSTLLTSNVAVLVSH
jgi:nucleotide-binding universal stress UspA family protein